MMEATAASGPWPDVVAISILSSSSNAHRALAALRSSPMTKPDEKP
jgi:hypothetical protein